ncbi:MAG: TatD family hydrolase [Lacibacter sp.]|jgi:TatD DNase family protein
MPFYINIHSHSKAIGREWVLQNLHSGFEDLTPDKCYSVGLHPWFIHEEALPEQLRVLEEAATRPQVKAIGECGLDRLCNTPMSLQKDAFHEQILLAIHYKKPLIVHCVRALDETIRELDRTQFAFPVLFHGFAGSSTRALQLTQKGYYLSFGKQLLQSRMQQMLSELPKEQWLLETDDHSIPIERLYEIAAKSLNIPEDVLSLQIQKNATSFLGFAPTII